jgi:hypothetical protein
MTKEQEERIQKDAEYERLHKDCGCNSGPQTIGSDWAGQAVRDERCQESYLQPGLRERIAKRCDHAREESSRLNQLRELQTLLNQNPAVARILDLLEIVHA